MTAVEGAVFDVKMLPAVKIAVSREKRRYFYSTHKKYGFLCHKFYAVCSFFPVVFIEFYIIYVILISDIY